MKTLAIILCAASLLANALLLSMLHDIYSDHARLVQWSCDHGNGGYQCGEM